MYGDRNNSEIWAILWANQGCTAWYSMSEYSKTQSAVSYSDCGSAPSLLSFFSKEYCTFFTKLEIFSLKT